MDGGRVYLIYLHFTLDSGECVTCTAFPGVRESCGELLVYLFNVYLSCKHRNGGMKEDR